MREKSAENTHAHISPLYSMYSPHSSDSNPLSLLKMQASFFFFYTVWSKCLISKGLNMTVTDFSNNAQFASFYTPVSFEPDVVGVIISLKRSQHLTNPKLFVWTVNPNSINNKPFWLLFIKNHKAKFWEVAWWLLCELVRWQPERFISQFPYQHTLSPNWVQADERMMKMEKKKERGEERRPYCSIEISV